MSINQLVDIGTDIAAFFLFHPDDLAHRSNDPLDWYGYEFACRKEFEAGNMVAFRTGSDGGYQLRLTDSDLTDAEQVRQTGSWEWGLAVRHGKVLVDNGDFLPSAEASNIKKVTEDRWVVISDGDYRVLVHPIERDDSTLPDYVVRFLVVEKPLGIAASSSPPDLTPRRDSPPKAVEGISADAVIQPTDKGALQPIYPLLVTEGQGVLPGGSTSVAISDALFNAVQNNEEDLYLVLAPSDAADTIGTLCRSTGWSQLTGRPGQLKLRGERLVRVTGVTDGKLLPSARVEAVTQTHDPIGEAEIRVLKEAFDGYLQRHPKGKKVIPSFDTERIAAIKSGAALTQRLIEALPLPIESRLRLQGASDAERTQELIPFLEKN